MARFSTVVEAFIASRELDQASLSRLAFWVDALGDKEVATITPDDVDVPLLKLAERGLLGGKTPHSRRRKAASSCFAYVKARMLSRARV